MPQASRIAKLYGTRTPQRLDLIRGQPHLLEHLCGVLSSVGRWITKCLWLRRRR